MSSQQIDEMLTRVSQIMHHIDQGVIAETEIELIIALFASLAKPETRAATLRSFTRTFETIPPQPVTEPPDAPIVVESEKDQDGEKSAELTEAISIEPIAAPGSSPPAPFAAARIGARPSTDTTYGLSGERISRQLRGSHPRPAQLDEETTKNCRIIDVRSIRDPEDK